MQFDPKQLKNYPQEPGVYLMKNQEGTILYIGKAKNLKVRLKQYFQETDTREMIPYLISQITYIDTIVTPNEKEALILENNLIKNHQPKYNVLLKDDKMFVSLMLTTKHEWPMLKLVRHRGSQHKDGLYFGPYTDTLAAKETLDILSSLFPLRQCSDRELSSRKRPCILYSMKKCIAPCVKKCTQSEYSFFVDQTIDFLKGHEKTLIHTLKEKMEDHASKLEFEKAAHLLKTIRRLEHIQENNKSLVHSNRINSDAIGIYRHLGFVMMTILKFREGKLLGSDQFIFENVVEDESELLEKFILHHYQKETDLPKELLIPFLLDSSHDISMIIKESKKHSLKIHCPEKSEKKELVALALKNAKLLSQQHPQQEIEQETLLTDLQKAFGLSRLPMIIECFDTSNISGTTAVASKVCYINGKKEPKLYRSYTIKNPNGDDYHAMKEVLTRRFSKKKEELDLPDLIILDGGKGQLSLAHKILEELEIVSCDVIALAKEQGRHDKGLTREKVYTLHSKEPIILPFNSPLLFFLQEVRDETHRRAITLHKKQRGKKLLTSQLDLLPGIGPKKKKALLKEFGSIKNILQASKEELEQIKILNKKDISTLLKGKT